MHWKFWDGRSQNGGKVLKKDENWISIVLELFIATRGVRHKIDGANSSNDHPKTDHHEHEEDPKTDRHEHDEEESEKFEEEFRKAFLPKFMLNYRDPKTLNEFIAEFNDANAAQGYKIERKKSLFEKITKKIISLLFLVTLSSVCWQGVV